MGVTVFGARCTLHSSKTISIFFTGYKVEQPFEEDGYPFLFSIVLVLFQVEVIRTFLFP
jgi:hypothetical protein